MISFFLMKLTSAYYLLMIHHETFCETGTDFLDGKNLAKFGCIGCPSIITIRDVVGVLKHNITMSY